MKKSVLMYDYFRFMYTSDPGGNMIEQENYNVQSQCFQTDLKLFKCGISPLIFCGVSPNFHGVKPHSPPPLLHNGMKNMAATWYDGKVNNAGNL
jgi:hypothetical protein